MRQRESPPEGGGPNNPFGTKTQFVADLEETVHLSGDKKVFATWYDENGKVSAQNSFQNFWNEAGAIAHILKVGLKLAKGDQVVLCYDFGLQFFATFLGCIRAGVTDVLVYPPNPYALLQQFPR